MIKPFTVLTTFETDQLSNIHQNSLKESLRMSKVARFELDWKLMKLRHRKVGKVCRGFKYIGGGGGGGVQSQYVKGKTLSGLSLWTRIRYKGCMLKRFNKSTTIFHCLHSYRQFKWRHRMFKTQVEPRAASKWFHCKVLNNLWRHFCGL